MAGLIGIGNFGWHFRRRNVDGKHGYGAIEAISLSSVGISLLCCDVILLDNPW